MMILQKNPHSNRRITASMKFIAQCIFVSLLGLSAVLAKEGNLQTPDYENRPPKMMSQSVYKKMTAAQEALLSENYDVAKTHLKQILNRSRELKDFDKAKVFEMLASVSLATNQYENAVSYSQQAIDLKVLNQQAEAQIFHRLIYMYFFLENYERATNYFELWLTLELNPAVKTYFAAAQIYAASDKMEQALEYALKGMEVFKAAEKVEEKEEGGEVAKKSKLKESWVKLLIAIRLNLKKYQDVSLDLEQAISLWPERVQYYQQLSAVYQELKRGKEALVILSLAYQNNLIAKEVDLNRLGQQYRYHSNPHKGAIILEAELKLEKLKASEKNWEAIANAWLHARQWQQANSALQIAASHSDEGSLWLQLCQTSIQDELWENAKNYCQKAINKGQLNAEEGTARYLIALSEYYQGQLSDAVTSFERCAKWVETKETCESWQTYASQAIVTRDEEALRVRQNKTERLRRQQNQQEIVDKALLRKI